MKPIIKSIKLILTPSLLAVSLALSACSNTSPVNEVEISDDTNDNSAAIVPNTSTQTADMNNTDPVTAEQIMMDSLSRYRWTLATATDNSNQPITALMTIKDQVTLRFDRQQSQDTLSYSVGCNMIGARYQIQDQTLSISDSMSTKMSCGDLDATENRLNELMQGDSKLILVEAETPKLTQVTSDAVTLVWIGNMTAQAKYKGKGETIFWSVSAKSQPCSENQAQICLQVKPVTYDEQGIKTGEGNLVEFAGVIDGYEHDGTHDEVLRLQRFKTDVDTVLVDNLDSKYAYVLDTVIESRVAK